MQKILQLKHWQVFGIQAGTLFLIIFYPTTTQEFKPELFANCIVIGYWVHFLLFILWLYIVGINLHNKLSKDVKMNKNLFIMSSIFSIIILSIFFITSLLNHEYFRDKEYLVNSVGVLVLICFLYVFYFISKSLVSIEGERVATIGEWIGYFLILLFLFTLSVWIIQPRVNRIFYEESE
jgi:hypothetical protein